MSASCAVRSTHHSPPALVHWTTRININIYGMTFRSVPPIIPSIMRTFHPSILWWLSDLQVSAVRHRMTRKPSVSYMINILASDHQLPTPNRTNCSDCVPTSACPTPNLEDRTRQSVSAGYLYIYQGPRAGRPSSITSNRPPPPSSNIAFHSLGYEWRYCSA